MSYNEEEVKELFEVVFKLSAKDVNDKLIKVRNRPEIAKRRWFWELLQNAKDAVEVNEKVSARLIIDLEDGQPFVNFQHSGNPFKYQDAKNLIFPYSDKSDEENSDKSGRFGTGFLATHILSKKIHVSGIYLKDIQAYNFGFTLDRSGNDKPEIAQSIDRTWQEFRDKRTQIDNYTHKPGNYETSFKYPLDDETLNLVYQSIQDFDVSLPYALAFISKIQKIEIHNKILNTSVEYQKIYDKTENLNECLKKVIIERKILKNEITELEDISLVIGSDSIVDIAVQIITNEEKIEILGFTENQPMLFCPFPLISANDFKFPVVINSVSFLPKEERDGIWLADTIEGKVNQALLERVLPLYQSLANYASKNNWQSTHLLLSSLKDTLLLSDFNQTWFKDRIQKVAKFFVKSVPLVDTPNRERLPISSNNIQIHFPTEIKEEYRLQLWEFMYALFPNRVPKKEHINDWYEVIWEDCSRYNINSFSKFIAQHKSITTLQNALNKSQGDALDWLNDFISFISIAEPTLLNGNDSQILPNQFGIFKRKDELYIDDDTIDQELKEILADISKVSNKVYDWRSDLLDKKINLELPATRTRNISLIGNKISEVVKELLKEDSPSNELRTIFSQLLNWFNDNPYKAKEYFKGLKTETLLYRTTNESKIKHITDLLQKDRDGKISVELLSSIDTNKIALLQDPNLELKIRLGEQVLTDMQKEKEEFEFKKKTGDVFENIFHRLINQDNRLKIQKVEGEEDFIILNPATNKTFYIELKSTKNTENQINMTHKQAKKAYNYPDNYFLCIIPNNGQLIDEDYFILNARFDSKIGHKLAKKVNEAITFEAPETGLLIEFEDAILKCYNKYRYKFNILKNLWGQDSFEIFISKLFN